jgi:adenylate cyclase
VATWALALLLGLGVRSLAEGAHALAERRRLRQAFDGAVSPPVLQAILSGRLSPRSGGERRSICVLFADLRDFTALSEHLPPEDVTALLNRHFEHMAQAIHQHGGTLDKFIGDGIMAFFGAPQDVPQPCAQALAAAQTMHHALATFNAEQQRLGGPCLRMGVGLHWGDSYVGYVGARSRHAYSAIGDTVNTAARLEGLCKTSGWPVVLSEAVLQTLEPAWRQRVQPLGEQALKGRSPVAAHGWNPGKDTP